MHCGTLSAYVLCSAESQCAQAGPVYTQVSSHARSHPTVVDPPRDEQGRPLPRSQPMAVLDAPYGAEDVLSQVLAASAQPSLVAHPWPAPALHAYVCSA